MNLLNEFLELLYPTCCPACGEVTDPKTVWCEACLRPLWNPRLINSSFTDHLSGCYTLCNYEGAIRKCLIQLKYNGRVGQKRIFPPLLDKFPWWDRLDICDLVMPVPLSKKRKKERAYNQTDKIFQDWMISHGWHYAADGLVRFRNTHVQSLLSKQERYDNIKGAFHISPDMDVKGKTVLVVDDIYTTGATMEAVAHELKRAGAEKVMGLTMASGAS